MKINHSKRYARDAMKQDVVTLREITKETLWDILKLNPSDAQRELVASNAEINCRSIFSVGLCLV